MVYFAAFLIASSPVKLCDKGIFMGLEFALEKKSNTRQVEAAAGLRIRMTKQGHFQPPPFFISHKIMFLMMASGQQMNVTSNRRIAIL